MHRSSSSRLGYDDRRSYGAGGSRSHGNEDRRRDQSRKSDSSAPREPSQVQIFIEGLPLDARIPDLVDYFSTVGKIKIDRDANKPRVWLYHDKRTGDPTGEATITYYDNETQRRALDTYNGKYFMDRYELKVTPSIVKVHMAKAPPKPSGRFRGRGGRGGFRGSSRGGGGYRGGGGNRGNPREYSRRDRNSYSESNHRPYDHPSSYSSQSQYQRDRYSGHSQSRNH